jgi:hypothetical protein
MNLSLGGLSWLLAAIAWGVLTLRLWQQFQRDKGRFPKFFSIFSFCLTTSFLSFAAERIFFAGNTSALKTILVLGNFFLITGFLFLGYLLICIKFPQIQTSFVFIFFLIIDLTVIALNATLSPISLFEGETIVDYFPHIFSGILMFGIITIVSIPLGIILIQNALSFSSREERIKSFGLGMLCFSGIVAAFFSAIFKSDLIRSILMIIWSIGIILLTVFTQKSRKDNFA